MKKGEEFLSKEKEGEDFFSTKKRGARIFFDLKKGAKTFFRQIYPKTRPRYLVNIERSLIGRKKRGGGLPLFHCVN